MRKAIIVLLAVVLIIFGSLLIKSSLLGNAVVVSLATDPVAEPIAISLENPSSRYIPIEGKDYTISKENYFNGNQWVVVAISPLNGFGDASSMVFEKSGNSYNLVLGPGSAFSKSSLANLPSAVSGDLSQ